MKNPFGKSRKPGNAYVVVHQNGWTWEILKMYQHPLAAVQNPFARAFCFVRSPFCPGGEYGDTYLKDMPRAASEELQRLAHNLAVRKECDKANAAPMAGITIEEV